MINTVLIFFTFRNYGFKNRCISLSGTNVSVINQGRITFLFVYKVTKVGLY